MKVSLCCNTWKFQHQRRHRGEKKEGRGKKAGGTDDGTDEGAAAAVWLLCLVRRSELWDLDGDACEQGELLIPPKLLKLIRTSV